MDIRCGSCSKLFRVADEKIAGKGIRFKCSKCGEVITVTKQDFEMDLLAREGGDEVPVIQPPPAAQSSHAAPVVPPAPAVPAEQEAREYQPPAPETEPEAREYQPQDTPQAGLDDFDFSEPHAAAQHAQKEDAGGDTFSFEAQTGEEEQESGGELSISEEEANEAEAAFSFPTDMISEPERKPAFAAEASEAEGEPAAESDGSEAAEVSLPAPALGDLQEDSVVAPALHEETPAAPAEESPRGPVFTPPPRTGPVFTPPAQKAPAQAAREESEIDLGAALAIPKGPADDQESAVPEEAPAAARSGAPAGSATVESDVHPFASGTMTGAVAGLGCALPVVAFLVFGFGVLMKFVPLLSSLPFYHIVLAAGAGIFSLGSMIGILVAVIQARAGRKLFFLLNMLIAAVFGAGFGAGMHLTVAVASGKGIMAGGLAGAAAGSGVLAFLVSIVLVIARRIMIFTKHETFTASLGGGQKAGVAVTLVVVLLALYAQGSLTGRMERATQDSVQRFQQKIAPDGLSVVDAKAYLDPESGDLVITGTVKNALARPKAGWAIDLDIYGGDEKIVGTVSLANGIQLFSERDWGILRKRGKDVETLRAQMLLALQSGEIPAKGNVPFEAHMMEPPQGVTGFLPRLRMFDLAATITRLSAEEE